jgi:hypothetical protein
MKLNTRSILFAIAGWSLLLLYHGYRFGTNDHVELLPYTLFLHDHSLYPHDFFIQGLHATVPNERTVFASLLLPFVNCLPVACFVLHFLSTILLLTGLEKFALRFIKNRYWVWIAILFCLGPLDDFTLGNVELYSNCVQASSVATAIVIWAINYFLDRKYITASIIISIATITQLLEGLDVMIVLSLVMFYKTVIERTVDFKKFAYFLAIFALTAGIYLVIILSSKSSGASSISSAEVFKIMFEFRHPHHFMFSTFPVSKKILFAVFTAVGIFYYYMRNKDIAWFLVFSFAGVVCYAVATDIFHFVPIANFQFYKITSWVKFLGMVTIISIISEWGFIKSLSPTKIKFDLSIAFIIATGIVTVLYLKPEVSPFFTPYQFSKGYVVKDPMLNICTEVKNITPNNAVFIVPFDNSEFKYYAQRSCYVEFKANVRNKQFTGEWHRRINEVYGVNYTMPEKGFALHWQAGYNYYVMPADKIARLKKEGVTHMLVNKSWRDVPHKDDHGKKIAENEYYAVYQL